MEYDTNMENAGRKTPSELYKVEARVTYKIIKKKIKLFK